MGHPAMCALVMLAALVACSTGHMYDVWSPFKAHTAPPGYTCLRWQDALTKAEKASMFVNSSEADRLHSACAIPGKAVGKCQSEHDCPGSYYGPICPAKSPAHGRVIFVTCRPSLSVPEQINLQTASDDTVVVGFATFETQLPSAPPQALFGPAGQAGGPATSLSGVSHWFQTSHANEPSRNYSMHFIRFGDLSPRAAYEYKVRSGAPNAPWSQVFSFRAPYGPSAVTAEKPTRVNIYGDMGNTAGNNMGNLLADCEDGSADLIVHMGDHCYNLGDANDRHGDAYLNAFQPVLAKCPWLPIIGNHESTLGPSKDKVDASTEQRYLNQTWGVVGGLGGPQHSAVGAPLRVRADTALGALITSHSLYASGGHGANPSRTSQWSSTDIGLIHVVALDLDPGPPAVFSGAQLAWFEADMAAAVANRDNVPWIIVASHFPLLSDRLAEEPRASAAWYTGDEAEMERNGAPWDSLESFARCDPNATEADCVTVEDAFAPTVDTLSDLLDKYHVDMYLAGHVHSYSASWPMYAGKYTESFTNPKGTVHITEGNGGVPTASPPPNAIVKCASQQWRICGTGMNYGRLTTSNHSVLVYEHIENPTGRVTDSFAITRTDRHP